MAPRGTKRKSAAAEASAKCLKVQKALPDALLKGMAKVALITYKEKRHEYETEVIGEIGKALEALAGSKSEAIEKLQVDISGAPGEKEARITALKEAEAALAAKVDAVAAKKAELKTASEATATAKETLKTAKHTQKTDDKEFYKLGSSVETLQEADKLVDLGDKKALKLVSSFEDFDSSLLSALPSALKEDPRSPFNQTTIDQFKAALKTCTEKYQGLVAAEQAGVDARASAVTAADAAATSAKTAEKDLEKALEALHGEEKEAKKAVNDAKKKLSHYYPDMKELMDGYDAAKEELTDFNTEVIGAFNELKERVEPPPEPEPVEEEAPAETPAAAEAEAPAAEAPPAEEPAAAA